MFTLTDRDLRKLMRMHYYPFSEDKMVFIGFRACLPISIETGLQPAAHHQLALQTLDYKNLRCTIGQWLPNAQKLMLAPGSTVPHVNNIRKSLDNPQNSTEGKLFRTNQLELGYFKNYKKGRHRHLGPTSHQAFRMDYPLMIRRTADDTDFELDDQVEYEKPYDNIHASYTESLESGYFASAGCQVIMGYPKRKDDKFIEHTGPWKVFLENAYALKQQTFAYALFSGSVAHRISAARVDKKVAPILRFGSNDQANQASDLPPLVSIIQEKLQNLGYKLGAVDGDFGPKTWKAVFQFQTDYMEAGDRDGAMGPITAKVLGVDWKKENFDTGG